MEKTENHGREAILLRIRSALRVPVPRQDIQPSRKIFPSIDDPLERFQKECAVNKTECVVTPDIDESVAAIASILGSIPTGKIFIQDAPLLRRMAQSWKGGHNICWSSEHRPSESSQASITLAESLVAASGSVFVSSECGGRLASVVSPVHIVVATSAQLAPTLDTAFAWMREHDTVRRNSMVCLITGPSRTGDIERIIVMGAHGPRRLIVVLAMGPE